MGEDEKFVREHWTDISVTRANTYPSIWLALGGTNVQGWPFKTDAEAWSAARAFTEQRLEEIRQLEAEIAFMDEYMFTTKEVLAMAELNSQRPSVGFDATVDLCRSSRIINRLQRELTTLQQGMNH